MKAAYITPIVKKSDMDLMEAKSYRPISNLSVLSKLLSEQLVIYLKPTWLLPKLHVLCLPFHGNSSSKVVGDIIHALDTGNIALLTLLDLSAASYSVDHGVLLQRLQKSYGLYGTVIGWFAFYLSGRSRYVRTPASSSSQSFVLYGVPQRSVVGPILFVLYVADVLQLVKDHGLIPHARADDTQILGICCHSESEALQNRVSDCLDAVGSWMAATRLILNNDKTEAL